MAVRADLGSLMSGQRSYNPFGNLLEGLFAPGTAYGGYVKDRPRAQEYDALALLRGGSDVTGITPWNQLFGEGGRVLDPAALLRSLNVGSVLTTPPTAEQGFRRQYGSEGIPSPNRGNLYGWEQQQQDKQFAGTGKLGQWLAGLTDFLGRRTPDPNDLRYTRNQLAPGVNLGNTTLDALNAWAQETFGVDLLTLAGSSPDLLGARQEAEQDPYAFFDPENPGVLKMDKIPGLGDADSAARLDAYQQAVQNLIGETTRGMIGQGQGLVQQQQLGDEEANRTALGRYLANTLQAMQGAQQAQAQNPADLFDYSYLMASGLQPGIMARSGANALGGAGGGY